MKNKIICILFILLTGYCWAKTENKYNLFINPDKEVVQNIPTDNSSETLFILDYSNSMNETLFNATKYEMLLQSMKFLLTHIPPNNRIGVRLYGQRWGITPLDACRASTLAVPIESNNINNITQALLKYSPRGMTPITYALKQAVKKDFHTTGIKHIILITDGGENCDESPCTYAMNLIKYRKDILIDVIAFNIDNSYDLDQLECVAKVTKGQFYQAETTAELAKSLKNAFNVKKEVDAKILGR